MDAMDIDGAPASRLAAGPSALPTSSSTPASLQLHRLRFVDWSPSSITALSFAPSSSIQGTNLPRGMLAIGRENGTIDLCLWIEEDSVASASSDKAKQLPSLAKGWTVDTTLVNSIPSKVDSLCFVVTPSAPSPSTGMPQPPSLRLFSSCGGSVLTEHFLPPHLAESFARARAPTSNGAASPRVQGTTRTLPSLGGAIWSLAPSPLGKLLAVGCEDGHVRMIDIDEGRFEHLSQSRAARRAGDGSVRGVVTRLDRAKTRVLCLAWGPPVRRTSRQASKAAAADSDDSSDDDDDDDELEDSFILGGTSSSHAVLWDTKSGRISHRLAVERSRSEQSIIWSVAVLPDGTCAVGDSNGKVTFFDSRTRTAIPGASLQAHGSGADVLTLCAGPDGRSLYSAGVDQKVTEFALLGGAGVKPKWVQTASRRLHAHDIRALAIEPALDLRRFATAAAAGGSRKAFSTDRLPILASGGVDFNLVLIPAASPSGVSTAVAGGSRSRFLKAGGAAGAAASTSTGPSHAHNAARDMLNPISSNSLTTFADTTQRRIPFVPSTSRGGLLGGGGAVCFAKRRGWVVLRREQSIGIWSVSLRSGAPTPDEAPRFSKLLEMELKVVTPLVGTCISDDGRWLAVSDLVETKLFQLRPFTSPGGTTTLEPKRVRSLGPALRSPNGVPGSSALSFTPDCQRLVLATYPGSMIHVVELPGGTSGAEECRLLRSFAQHRRRATFGQRAQAGRKKALNGGAANGKVNGNGRQANGRHDQASSSDSSSEDDSEAEEDDDDDDEGSLRKPRDIFARIDVLCISSDGQYLVSIDTSRRIHTFSLDNLAHHHVLPSPPVAVSGAAFDCNGRGKLARVAIVLPTNQVLLYDLERLGGASAGNAFAAGGGAGKLGEGDSTRALEAELRLRLGSIREQAVGCSWVKAKDGASVLAIYGAGWLCTATEKGRTSSQQNLAVPVATSSKARKRGSNGLATSAGVDGNGARDFTSSSSSSPWSVKVNTKFQSILALVSLPLSPSSSSDLLPGSGSENEVTGSQAGRTGSGASSSSSSEALVMIERPFFALAKDLPPAYRRGAAYGS